MPEVTFLNRLAPILAKGREFYAKTEKWLSKLTKRQLILLSLGVGLGFLALGTIFGVIFTPYRSINVSDVDFSTSRPPAEEQTVIQTGVVRRLTSSVDGANFSLETSGGGKLLLKSDRIDLSFFEGASVTVEGKIIKTTDGSQEILLVEKVRIK